MCFLFTHLLVHSTSIYFALGTMFGGRDWIVNKNDRFLSLLDFSIKKEKEKLKNMETGWHTGENADSLKRQIPMGSGGKC